MQLNSLHGGALVRHRLEKQHSSWVLLDRQTYLSKIVVFRSSIGCFLCAGSHSVGLPVIASYGLRPSSWSWLAVWTWYDLAGDCATFWFLILRLVTSFHGILGEVEPENKRIWVLGFKCVSS